MKTGINLILQKTNVSEKFNSSKKSSDSSTEVILYKLIINRRLDGIWKAVTVICL